MRSGRQKTTFLSGSARFHREGKGKVTPCGLVDRKPCFCQAVRASIVREKNEV